MKLLIKPLALILTNCLLLAQVKMDPGTIKVAYAGIKVDNVEPWVEAELQKKLSSIFDGLRPGLVMTPELVKERASVQVDSLFMGISNDAFQRVADETGTQYVYMGKFKNVSPDNRRIMIQGEFYRYNALLKSSFRYEVLKYYERMNDEAKVIQTQLVDSIPAAANPPSLTQVGLVFGMILLIGVLFMSLTGTKVWGEGPGNGGGEPTES